jgi:pimeloyl-ACP methyl ester carboxylesterase
MALGEARVHVVEAGDPQAPAVLFLHGWPESWAAWREVMRLASASVRAVAIDLPGVGESAASGASAVDGSKRELARIVHRLVSELKLRDVTIVGHDIGGMIAFAYLRNFPDLGRAVIADVVIPGVPPWEEVLRNPNLWHFALHQVPELPEQLIQGRQRPYFDFFYDGLANQPKAITAELRDAYADAYSNDAALTSALHWYRAFPQDAQDNQRSGRAASSTPVLYLRGERQQGADIDEYLRGLRGAGLTDVTGRLITGSGHYTPEEDPQQTWQAIAEFIAATGKPPRKPPRKPPHGASRG